MVASEALQHELHHVTLTVMGRRDMRENQQLHDFCNANVVQRNRNVSEFEAFFETINSGKNQRAQNADCA